jgi:transcriptional regulator of heat shock response
MPEQQATFVESYLADHVHDMDSQEEVQAQAEEAMRLFKELEDLKKCYVQRWVEVVDLSVLMELGRQHKLKEVEDFDLQQVIEAIQDLEVDIDFKDSDTN